MVLGSGKQTSSLLQNISLYIDVCRYPQRSEEGVRLVSCQTWVLGIKLRSEEQHVLLMAKPSYQLCIYLLL